MCDGCVGEWLPPVSSIVNTVLPVLTCFGKASCPIKSVTSYSFECSLGAPVLGVVKRVVSFAEYLIAQVEEFDPVLGVHRVPNG